NEEGRYINAWAKDEANLFLPKNEIIGRTLADMYGPRFAKPFNEILKKVIETGKTHNLEYKCIIAGDQRWCNAKYSLIRDKNAPGRQVSICIHGITDRKKAEFSMKESEQKFRLLAENVPGVIYHCHNDQHITLVYLNARVKEL